MVQSSSSSEMRLYVRRKNINDLPQNVTINIEQLEKIYLSATIQEIYIICIDDFQFDKNSHVRQNLAAVIVSQTDEITILKELETTSKLQQLNDFQIPWIILIQKESLCITEQSRVSSLDNINRDIFENQYRTKIMNILLSHDNIYHEAIDTFLDTMHQQKMKASSSLIEKDKILDPILHRLGETNKKVNNNDIFLTGSTGFLGNYLLDELLKKTDANIYCLVRSIPSTHTSSSRVFYFHGDLTLPQLGLTDHQYEIIVTKVRSIYHCGAAINFTKSYIEHRRANVLGTLEIIKLSRLANCRINYISTLSVLDRNDQSGYVQSKRVAECLLEQARERGLLVSILRPGYISWSVSTGDFNKTDWVTLLLLDLIKFNSVPETNLTFKMTPVDHLSKSIVELGESEETVKATVNLSETHSITFKTIWTEICRQQTIEPHYLDVIEWRQKLDEYIKANPRLLNALQLFSNVLTDTFSEDKTTTIANESYLNLPIFIKVLLQK